MIFIIGLLLLVIVVFFVAGVLTFSSSEAKHTEKHKQYQEMKKKEFAQKKEK